jgi:hypothetical protein
VGLSRLENIRNCNIEVKIKQGNEMLDATIEMVDGVMVVSPKEVKFEPKEGDVLSSFFNGKYQGTFVFEEASECGEAIFHFALDSDGRFIKGNGCNYFGYIYDARPATEEEKKLLFDKLKEKSWEWDVENKELVKLKWKPKVGDTYFRTDFNRCMFICYEGIYRYDTNRYIKDYVEKGWCFKTKEECQEFCNRLNDAINQVKP